MSRRVKEFIEIRDYTSLDRLIEELTEIRNSMPAASEAEVKLRGDDVFGRQLTISFMRAQTPEEAACDARYAECYREAREQERARLQEEAGPVCHLPRTRSRGLRIVA